MPAVAQAPDEAVYAARVSRVFDGDTLWVQPLEGGRYRKLRIDGIDAPEICQEGGLAARDVLAARVLHQVVEVRVRRHDDYGRGLARLRHQGDDIGGWLVSQGVAWSYRWGRSPGPYGREEEAARRARLGVVADTSAEQPRDFRRRHGPCAWP
ncbi:thermonuclease family protein [Hydrogenophaga sp.]|uniref:thermonuclease family protein n=1 Tax=Hydrogenophaga sp. TaxID=1904254 RepID=UPI002632C419|nr:thermonuclease family protein [Hydrogenophaga sp.]